MNHSTNSARSLSTHMVPPPHNLLLFHSRGAHCEQSHGHSLRRDCSSRRRTHTHSTPSRRCHALRPALRPAPPPPRPYSGGLLRGGLGGSGGGGGLGGGGLGGGGGGGSSSSLGLGLHLPKLHRGQQPVTHQLAHEGARSERR